MENVEIKPCPFCGSQPKFVTPKGESSRWVQLKCCNLNCPLHNVSTFTYQDKIKVINLWNQRV